MPTTVAELAAWGVKGILKYRLNLPEETPSNNVIKNMHFHAYKNLRHRWRYLVLKALEGQRPTTPVGCSLLVIHRKCAGQLDWDNAMGGLKPLLDCLVQATARNPDGLGLIVDDNPKTMPYPPFMQQFKAKRGEGSTEVLIYEIDQCPDSAIAAA
jgi:hypothetical protein